jgi:hypothetical protein
MKVRFDASGEVIVITGGANESARRSPWLALVRTVRSSSATPKTRMEPRSRPGTTAFHFMRWTCPTGMPSRAGTRRLIPDCARCLFDPGDSLFHRFGCAAETCVLVRPGIAESLYARAVGAPLPVLEEFRQ